MDLDMYLVISISLCRIQVIFVTSFEKTSVTRGSYVLFNFDMNEVFLMNTPY